MHVKVQIKKHFISRLLFSKKNNFGDAGQDGTGK